MEKTKFQKKEQIQKLISQINSRILNIQVLKGGWIMSGKILRMTLQENKVLNNEWEILHNRKEKLKTLLWKLP